MTQVNTSRKLRSLMADVSKRYKLFQPLSLHLNRRLKNYLLRIQFHDDFPNVISYSKGRATYLARVM